MNDVAWDPGQYLRFADLRLRPALELLGRVFRRTQFTVSSISAAARAT